jgi:hypothetical protein
MAMRDIEKLFEHQRITVCANKDPHKGLRQPKIAGRPTKPACLGPTLYLIG